METADIQRRFVDFFERNGHTVVPSASLVSPDPSLLFTIAGMVPFIPYLTGQETPPYRRAVSTQKCVRTLDIEEVGKTTRHGTFFQMNGNFSFGDYFKEGAIEYAWDLLTRSPADGGYGFAERDLWVTVFEEDDEAERLWRQVTGIPAERIQRLGKEDNYWHTGQPGPAGPDSEIFYDRGPDAGPGGGPANDPDRYMELWNLVFMQYERGEGAGFDFPIIGELENKNIDTGMGLERVAYLLQGVDNIYEIDQVYPVIDRAADLAGVRYGTGAEADVRLRVVADHVRSAMMIINDGVTPGNEGRGYVVRRLLRRSVRAMRLLGVDIATLPELLPVSRDAMAPVYPELIDDFERISATVYAEEESFIQTLKSGTQLFDLAAAETKHAGQTIVSGDTAFRLHDTYGFPIDLTLEMAAEQGLAVDEDMFRTLMAEQRGRAKADAQAKKTGAVDLSVYGTMAEALATPIEFLGYDATAADGRVVGLVVSGATVPVARIGDKVDVVLDQTPFYAEGGGQLADHGSIEVSGGGGRADVHDVQKPINGLIVHRATITAGELAVGDVIRSSVDVDRRKSISRSHTATHMVHQALRDALGDSARQAGSEDAPGRLRLDFTAPSGVPTGTVDEVEQQINELLIENTEVTAEVMPKDQAFKSGALAFFGEKYGDEVRVVSIGEWSKEFCGGTHAPRVGALGVVKVLGESSIGQGVRRVEALVGLDAYRYFAQENLLVSQLTDALKVRRDDLPDRVDSIVTQLKDTQRELERLRLDQLVAAAPTLAAEARDVFGVSYVSHRAPTGATADDLRTLASDVRKRLPSDRPGVVAIAAEGAGGRPLVVVTVNDTGREWGLKAGALVREAAGVLGGGGGGKDDIAQGGGSDVSKLDESMRAVEHAVGSVVTATR